MKLNDLLKKNNRDGIAAVNSELESLKSETTYKVSFDTDGGTPVPEPQVLGYKELVIEPDAPTKEGYTFDGWLNGENLWDFQTDVVEASITLTTKWLSIFTVTFDANGGIPTPESQEITDGQLVTEPEPITRDDDVFVCWLNGLIPWDFETDTVAGPLTLTAAWETRYTVVFDANGGIPEPAAQAIIPEGLATNPGIVTKSDGIFVEWQLNGEAFDFETPITEDIQLVAYFDDVLIAQPTVNVAGLTKAETEGEYSYEGPLPVTVVGLSISENEEDWTDFPAAVVQSPIITQLEDLSAGTEYFVKHYMIIGGTRYESESQNFSTCAEPSLWGLDSILMRVTVISGNSGYEYDGSDIEEIGIDYSDDEGVTYTRVPFTTESPFAWELTGLTANTPYYLRQYMIIDGTEFVSGWDEYSTVEIPTAGTDDSHDVTMTLAHIVGVYSYAGSEGTIEEVGIEYSDDEGVSWTEVPKTPIPEPEGWEVMLTGLTPLTTYRYAGYIKVDGVKYDNLPGGYDEFTTLEAPVVTLTQPTQTLVYQIDFAGQFTYGGGLSITETGFAYSTGGEFYDLPASGTTSPFTKNHSGLGYANSQEYSIKSYVIIGVERFESVVKTFNSLPCPVPTTLAITDIASTTATFNGSYAYSGDHEITRLRFRYSDGGPNQYSDDVAVIATPFSKGVIGLTAGTNYGVTALVTIDGTELDCSAAWFNTLP